MHIFELHYKLMEAQGKNINGRIRPYTASARCRKDIENLSKIGMTSEDISYSLDLPISFVQKDMARIVKANEAGRRYLRTGTLSSPEFVVRPAVFTIFQR